MQANNGSIIAVILITALVIIGSIFYVNSQIPEQQTIPTASEIANQIQIPDVSIPEADTQRQDEIWEGVYEDEIEELEDEAIEVCEDEFDFDDIEDLFSDYLDVEFREEYEDDREIDIINLGLDDEDDRHLIINGILKVRIDDDYNELVYGVCEVTSHRGDLEADLTFSL